MCMAKFSKGCSSEPLTPSLRTRHFSAPASMELAPGKRLPSELQWRISLKKSRLRLHKNCSQMSLEEGDEPLKIVVFEPAAAPVEKQTTCPTLPVSDEEMSSSRSPMTKNLISTNCCYTSSYLSLPTTHLLPLSSHQRENLPPHRWPSETRHDPGGGPKCNQCKTTKIFPPARLHLFTLIFSFSLILSAAVRPVESKRCSSMMIRHDVNKFRNLTNCSIIEGHLIIAAMKDEVPVNFTFPKLREVTEYVILYEAQNIVNLNTIFPNLAVIRGNKLVMDFALVIYRMDNMVEIGLTGLTHILRGGVRIEKNRNLCYVNTISWQSLVHQNYHSTIHIEENEYDNMCPNICPKECPTLVGSAPSAKLRNCWNSKSCQIDPNNLRANHTLNGAKCDEQCIGGCSHGQSHLKCFACKNVMDEMSDGTKNCIDKCPDEYLLYGNWRCIDDLSCSKKVTHYNAETIGQERPYKNYKGKCLEYCPPETEEVEIRRDRWTCEDCHNCAKECSGTTIRSLETLRKMNGCTKIMGDLAIQISGSNVVDELEKNLGKVTVITGSLKISRSFPIISLDFFKSLTEIQGTQSPDNQPNQRYSLEILENENLQKLFPAESKVKITLKNGKDAPPEKGKAFIHYNQKLCRSEIEQLLNRSEMFDPGENSQDISYGTNGHKSVCSEKVLKLEVSNADGRALQLTFENYKQYISEVYNVDTRVLLNYEIHYREIDRATYEAKNVTKFGGRDACGNDEWMIDDHPPSKGEGFDNGQWTWPDEVSIITDKIKPYSYYAVFVTTLLIRSNIDEKAKDIKSAASEIVYFQTPEANPDPVQDIKVNSVNFSTVNISWTEPSSPNGVIHEYIITVEHHSPAIERLMKLRPYCDDNYEIEVERIEKSESEEKKKTEQEQKVNEKDLENGHCDCSSCDAIKKQKKQDQIESQDEKVEESQFHDELLNAVYHIDLLPKMTLRKKRSVESNNQTMITNDLLKVPKKRKMETEIQQTQMVYSRVVNGTLRHVVISNLTHFSKYTVTIKACHRPKFDPVTQREEKLCSEVTSLDFRTDKKEGADDITEPLRTNQATNNGTDVWLSWTDPDKPNLAIVYYQIRVRMQHDNKYPFLTCLTAADFQEAGRRYYPRGGTLLVSVRAVSLAGPGKYTEEVLVNSGEPSNAFWWYILLPIVAICLICAGVVFYYIYRKQRPAGDEFLPNPEYLMFQFKEIEIARDLIDKGRELGTGSFGTVYEGIYRAADGAIPCAIKEAKDDKLRHQLLGEADLMKQIKTPHVVRLLGVVTQGFPQFVVLELMELGDLKKHLRNLRKSPPTQTDILLMAIQVADGMAYLSTVPSPKIIHRDLAARNCMVNDRVIVKIGDFGLARDLCYDQDYYRMNGKDWLPVRWMSPESLRDSVFSSASDVWAYGVVLWEMVTLAEQPYQGLSNDEVLNFVKERRTMTIPNRCPELIASLMKSCWAFDADDRPSFIQICQQLLDHANDEFRRNSFITSSKCRRILQRMEMASGDADNDIPIEDAERAPLQANGSNGNGNGEAVRQLDNGHVIIPQNSDTLREFNNGTSDSGTLVASPNRHSFFNFGRMRQMIRNRMQSSRNSEPSSNQATATA